MKSEALSLNCNMHSLVISTKVLLETEKSKNFETGYKNIIQQGEEMATFAYWNPYLEMVEVLLLFLKGIRERNWLLHLTSVRCMIPWLFAYDDLNYTRYLPAYWQEMMNLPTTHSLTNKTSWMVILLSKEAVMLLLKLHVTKV